MKPKARPMSIAVEIDPLPWRELISTVCHDLKDPLASVVMGTGYLHRALPADEATAAARRVVEAIGRSTSRMSLLVSALSDLALLERHDLELRRATHDVAALARAAHEQLTVNAAPHGITTTLDLAADIEGLQLSCDGERLGQILAQLGAAALRVATEKGVIASRVRCDGATHVRFELETTVRSSAEPSEVGGASPRTDVPKVAMALARGLIELHGGKLEATRDDDVVKLAFAIPRTRG